MLGVKTFFSSEGINTEFIINMKEEEEDLNHNKKKVNLFDKYSHLMILKRRYCTGKRNNFHPHAQL